MKYILVCVELHVGAAVKKKIPIPNTTPREYVASLQSGAAQRNRILAKIWLFLMMLVHTISIQFGTIWSAINYIGMQISRIFMGFCC